MTGSDSLPPDPWPKVFPTEAPKFVPWWTEEQAAEAERMYGHLPKEVIDGWASDGRMVGPDESYYTVMERVEISRRTVARDERWRAGLEERKAMIAARRAAEVGAMAGRRDWWKELLEWDGTELDLAASLSKLPRHDSSGAKALIERVGDEVWSVPDVMTRGRFFRIWNGKTWEQDHGEVRVWSWVDAMWAAYQRALLQAGIGVEEAAEKAAGLKRAGGGSDADVEKTKATHLKIWNDRMKKHVIYFDRLGSRDGQSSCVEMLAHAPGRCKRDGEFDADPEWLVLGNGVLDLGVVVERLRDGSWTGWGPDALSEHSPSRAVTLLAGDLTYVPEAGVGDVFLRYLEGALPNPAVRWHLQKALGRALLGRPEDKMMLNLIGPPDSGKSVLLEILDDILGDYSRWVAADAFLQERGGGKGADAPNPALHSCRRAKLVLCSEPDSRKAWNSGLLKSLTGRDKQSTRTLHQQIQTWTPRFLLVVASNSFVKLDVADQALLQRIHLIEFPRSFRKPGPGETWESIPVDERADLSLTRRILDDEFERSCVLNWLLQGLEGYHREGLAEPAEMAAVRGEMVVEMSPVRAWLEEMLADGVLARDTGGVVMDCIGASEAFEMFLSWQAQTGEDATWRIGRNSFNRTLGVAASTNPLRLKNRGHVWRGRKNEKILDRLWPGPNWTGVR